MPLSNQSISEINVPPFPFHQLDTEYTAVLGNCGDARWKEPRALNQCVEESYLLMENSCPGLLGEGERILWYSKLLKPGGFIVTAANITLIHRPDNPY